MDVLTAVDVGGIVPAARGLEHPSVPGNGERVLLRVVQQRVEAVVKEMTLEQMDDDSGEYESKVLEGFANLMTDDEGRVTKEHDGDTSCSVALKLGKLYLKEKSRAAEEAASKDLAKQRAPPVPPYAMAARAKLEAALQEKSPMDQLWTTVCARTEELYLVHDDRAELFKEMLQRMVIEVARDDAEGDLMVKDIQLEEFKYLLPPNVIFGEQQVYWLWL